MPQISEMYFNSGVLFLVVSVAVGLQMSITGVHSVGGAHAHASLIGWVSSAIFGAYFALNPGKAETKLAFAQFWIFVGAATAMSLALYFMLMGFKGLSQLWPEAQSSYFWGSSFCIRRVLPIGDCLVDGTLAR